jgi:Tol biopolymer transport system component
MGEVYRARDTRLGRDVAIKVLHGNVADDEDRRGRFEREARAVAALSHPNILAIHDIGLDGDRHFVITEFLDGETLAQRLEHGALPVRRAIEIAVAIARGLSAAHGKGIAHRDLKPSNVFLLADGQVKILDFGLAKAGLSAVAPPGASADGENRLTSPTITSPAITAAGMILGTAGYMAPEQVRGQPVDGRADLFSLGVVLHEMLTGSRAFMRASTVESLSAILKEDAPDITTLRADLPPALDRIVRHCLEKNPAQRFQSAQDVIFALETLSGSGSSPALAGPGGATTAPALGSAGIAWTLAALATLALAASLLYPRSAPLVDAAPTFLALGAPNQQFHTHPSPAISPDGQTVAFWAPDAEGRIQLWVRDIRQPQARALPDTIIGEFDNDGMQPSFSPDGRTLLALFHGKMKRIPLDGGSPQTIADAPQPRGASWGVGDRIVYQPVVGGPLYLVSATGGTPQPLNDAKPIDDRRGGPRHPHFLPDGKHFLFNDYNRVYVASIDGGAAKVIFEASSRTEYADGRILYVKDRDLLAVPFDATTLTITGEPQRVVERVGSGRTSSMDASFALSRTGTIVYWEGLSIPLSELIWLDRSGRRVGRLDEPGHYNGISASNDLSRVAKESLDLQSNWYVTHLLDVTRGTSLRVSVDKIDRVNTLTPTISRDGTTLWFSGAPGIFRLDAGRDTPVLVGVNQGVFWINDVSADAKSLLFQTLGIGTSDDIWTVPLTGEPTPVPWLQTPASEGAAKFSPDGRWVAYLQIDRQLPAVYIDSFPTRGQRQRVSPGSGMWPMFSPDGKRLYYLTADFHMMEVPLTITPTSLVAATPVELFVAPRPSASRERVQFWPAADGQRFLFNARVDAAMPRTVNLVTNWTKLVSK